MAIPILCKTALLLTMVQAPESDSVEGAAKKVAEECVLAEGHPAARPSSQAVLRRDASHLVRRPAQFLPRIGRGEHSRGHVLANGLRAPLLC